MHHYKSIIALLSFATFFFVSCKYISGGKNKKSTEKIDSVSSQKSSSERVMRFGMVTGIKPEKISYYKELHAHAWPQVQKMIIACNIQNYSIYLQKINNDYFLFCYFEYTGNNFDADMKMMAGDTTTQRWWKETDPTQLPLPDAVKKHQIWTNMEEVFHQN